MRQNFHRLIINPILQGALICIIVYKNYFSLVIPWLQFRHTIQLLFRVEIQFICKINVEERD